MLMNGYKLKEALKLKKIELEATIAMYTDSLFYFEGEEKDSPLDLMETIMKLEEDVALIQTAQKYYNVNTTVNVEGLGDSTLEFIIKLLGSYGRRSKRFRDSSGKKKKRNYYGEDYGAQSRKKTEEYQVSALSKTDALKYSKEAEIMVSKIKTSIALANGNELSITFITKENL